MQNIWHWQQELTFWAAFVVIIVQMLNAAARNKVEPIVSAVAVAAGQYVLWSGGWYGQ